MYTKESSFNEVKDLLIDAGGYCDDICQFFSNEDLTGSQIVDKFRNDPDPDGLMKGRILNALKLLGKHFDEELNEEFIAILIEREVSTGVMLILWRELRHYPNISKTSKKDIKKYLKGKLPKAEKADEWDGIK